MFFGALATALAVGSQAIAGGPIPLPRGNFSLTVSGTECSNNTCGGVLNIIEAGATVRDSSGNGCGTHVAVVNTSPPQGPPQVATITHVFKLNSYDPATGIGDQLLTEYIGGSCKDAIFIPNNNAFQVTTGVLHFVVSEGGNRIDNVVTVLNVLNAPAVGFSLTFTERSQSPGQNRQ
jgi:hypothetical protein